MKSRTWIIIAFLIALLMTGGVESLVTGAKVLSTFGFILGDVALSSNENFTDDELQQIVTTTEAQIRTSIDKKQVIEALVTQKLALEKLVERQLDEQKQKDVVELIQRIRRLLDPENSRLRGYLTSQSSSPDQVTRLNVDDVAQLKALVAQLEKMAQG